MEQLLIIEDDIGLNQGLSKALKADDRQIISCQDLKAAKEQLLCGGVSLILLDINLPDGSGLELLREVKENLPGVPVILLTANDTDLDIVDGLERGADDYIISARFTNSKPSFSDASCNLAVFSSVLKSLYTV